MKNPTPKRGIRFWQAALVLGILVILAAVSLSLANRAAMQSGHYGSCQSNLKQIMLGVKQYIQDYDEKYPLVASASKVEEGKMLPAFGWADGIQPYIKSTQLYQCPSELRPPGANPTQRHYTDYWFNARLANKRDEQIEAQALTIAFGDGNDGADATDAHYHLLSVSPKWRNDETSPLFRHTEGANFAFVDGHAKWFAANRWKSELDLGDHSSFRLKPIN